MPTASLCIGVLLGVVTRVVGASSSPRQPTIGLSITDPGICLDDIECGPSSYCKLREGSIFSGRCTPRASVGASCISAGDCIENAYCQVAFKNVCEWQGALNEACNPVQSDSCRSGLVCKPNVPCTVPLKCDGPIGKCVPDKPRMTGESCERDRDCAQNDGFYCRSREGACAAKFRDGRPCNLSSDSDECLGFCLTENAPGSDRGICVKSQPLGGLCTADLQCESRYSDAPRKDHVLCNRPRGSDSIGRCAKTSSLLRTLGTPCETQIDLCDARRGLRCFWSPHLNRRACQHMPAPRTSSSGAAYCKQGSKLSKCPGPPMSAPTECRVERVRPWTQVPGAFVDGESFTTCLPKRRFVQIGAPCNDERDTCPFGTKCMLVTGVLADPFSASGPGSSLPAYCARVLRAGSACKPADKFRAQCGEGLQCVLGTCVLAAWPPKAEPYSHAGAGAPCEKLPCAPGLSCTGYVCAPQKRTIGLDGLCEDSATECRKGLVCRTRWSMGGRRRCRRPRGAGAFCESTRWCKRGLHCPVYTTAGRERRERRCFGPGSQLWLGQRCDQTKELTGPRCSTVQTGTAAVRWTRALRCLRGDARSFQCMVDVGPLGRCDEKKRRVCGDERFHCRGSVCMPKMNQ